LRVAVVGGGWAGIGAAVERCRRGDDVTLLETAGVLGGRARTVEVEGHRLDNGQHILIGAYQATLALMRQVGASPDALLLRQPLALVHADGTGLTLPPGAPLLAFARGVLANRGWTLRERLGLLTAAGLWLARGFRCDEALTVAQLTKALPRRVMQDLVEPLCVAALNTPARRASASVFLRVLKDALFNGPGCADLLLPRVPLGDLLPGPAQRWLQDHGATLRLQGRAMTLQHQGAAWQVDGETFDAVVLACSAAEASRLAADAAPAWSRLAGSFEYEPIVTVYTLCDGARLPQPLVALREGPQSPAQFVFDHGALGRAPGLFAWVVSGARPWVDRGLDACGEATLAQARSAFPAASFPGLRVLRVIAEKRATFLCTPGLVRPPIAIAPGLSAAGDYVEGPYPATLEGAVLAGQAAAARLG
jgi:squalene-associated FAD-dependent desaturase